MEHFFEVALNFLNSAEGAAATIAVVLEFTLRLIPSQKPLSIAHVVAAAMVKIGNIVSKAGALLDKVLPQSIKQ